MIDLMNETVDKIQKVLNDIKAIQNGAIVNPKTNEIMRDKECNIIYYKEKK